MVILKMHYYLILSVNEICEVRMSSQYLEGNAHTDDLNFDLLKLLISQSEITVLIFSLYITKQIYSQHLKHLMS